MKQSTATNPFFDDDSLHDFFGGRGNPFGPQEPQGRSTLRERRVQGLGSGVIVNDDGYIITNNHVNRTRLARGVKSTLARLKKRENPYDRVFATRMARLEDLRWPHAGSEIF